MFAHPDPRQARRFTLIGMIGVVAILDILATTASSNDHGQVSPDDTFDDVGFDLEGGGSGNGSRNNRSDLGDGTNPGQGASHSQSGNQGTNNPNNAHH